MGDLPRTYFPTSRLRDKSAPRLVRQADGRLLQGVWGRSPAEAQKVPKIVKNKRYSLQEVQNQRYSKILYLIDYVVAGLHLLKNSIPREMGKNL